MGDPASGGGWSEGAPASAAPTASPRYERRQRLGKGGMGVVTVVWDHLLEREVALKEALEPDGTLLHEARLTALLDHPNIVPVYDATTAPDGRVTYTMRLLRGRPLDAVIASTPPGPARVRWLRALLAACEAVAYAHVSGVVHRDLKPANIVVGELGETQVVDWGLARHIGDLAAGPAGTTGFTSPEQAKGAPPAPTDDVWALGATLAALLGEHAIPELAAIVRRAMAPLPERYPDARALASDLAEYIDGRPVAAYRYSAVEVITRLIRRHRLTVGVAGVVAIVGVLAVAGQWRQTVFERDRALVAEGSARQELATSLGGRAAQALRAGMLPEAEVLAIHALRRGTSPEAMGVLASLAAGARLEPAEEVALPPGCVEPRLFGGARHGTSGDGGPVAGTSAEEPGSVASKSLGEHEPATASDRPTVLCSGPDGVSAWDVGASAPRWRSPIQAAWIGATADRVLVQDQRHHATLLRLSDGQEVVPTWGPTEGRFRCFEDSIISFGITGVTTWADDRRTSFVPPCPSGEILQDMDHGAAVCSAGSLVIDGVVHATPFNRPPAIPSSIVLDGGTAWIGTFGGEVFAWEIATDRLLWSTPVGVGAVMTLRRLGDRVLAAGSRGARLLDPQTGSPIAALPAGAQPAEPRGAALWTVGDTLIRWSVPREAPLREVVAGVGLAGGAVSPDGKRVALSGGAGHLSLWSVATGQRLGMVQDQSEPLKAPIFLADGTALAGGSTRSTAGLRRLASDGTALPGIAPYKGIKRLAALSDGSFLATGFGTDGAQRYDGAGQPLPLPAHEGPVMVDLSASPDHREAIAIDAAGATWLYGPDRLEALAVMPESGAVATAKGVRVWAEMHAIHVGDTTIEHPWTSIVDLAITADATRVITAGLDGTARVLDAKTGELLAVLTGHDERVSGVDISPDARWVLTTSWDHRARRWDLTVLDQPVPAPPALSLEAALQATAR